LDYTLAKGFVNKFPDLESVKLMKLFLHCLYPCRISHCLLNGFRFSSTHGGVSCCLELSVGEEESLTLEVYAVKNSSYKGPKRRSNSCCDRTVVSAEEETFCATKDVKVSNRRFPVIDDVNKGSLEAESIVRATLTRVRFRLLTTPFYSGVRGVEA
ncbi:hypothetical protein Tco_1307641, partial [Tanacetum coccineum]